MIVMVSGGFDPLHIGHIKLIEQARNHGDVVVALNSDDWLKRKKGYVYQSYDERKAILSNIKGVWGVVLADEPNDDTCIRALEHVKPDIFANGGDRLSDNTPEATYCNANNIKLLWNIGGDKIQHSSKLVWQERPWGRWRMLEQTETHWVKYIEIYPHSRCSLQTHKHRDELWFDLDSKTRTWISRNEKHRLVNSSDKVKRLIEIATGKPNENDITRIEDDYGRDNATATTTMVS